MQRYRHFSLPSLLSKIMNSDRTCPCLCCSASLQRTGSRVSAPWNHNRNIPLEGPKDMRETSFTKRPFPNRGVKQWFTGAVFTSSIFRRHLQCRHSKLELTSASAFPPCGFDPSLLLSIENSPSAMAAFKHITWQIIPLCILHVLLMNFTLSVVVPQRIANSVPVELFRTVQLLELWVIVELFYWIILWSIKIKADFCFPT